jgi:P4 family phage/plasmid primase-like protien
VTEPSFLEARGLAKPKVEPHKGPKMAKRLVEAYGCLVHPLKLGSKAPATKNGFHDAKASAADIIGNYGVWTGGSRIVAVDLDDYVPNNEIEQFVAEYELPPTFTVKTGSGGRSLWYRAPEGIELHQRLGMAVGVDIKAGGSYVLGPGNQLAASAIKEGATGDGSYSFVKESPTEFAPLPQKLAQAIQEAKVVRDPTEKYEHAAYDKMLPGWRGEVDRWCSNIVALEIESIRKLGDLGEGERNEKGYGWETGVLEYTRNLASIVKADWNAVSYGDVMEKLQEVMPDDNQGFRSHGLGLFVRGIANDAGVPPREIPGELVDWTEFPTIKAIPDPDFREAAGSSEAPAAVVEVPETKLADPVLSGAAQFHIKFDSQFCLEVNDKGREEIKPATAAKTLLDSWPIAKQPLTRGRTWWAYRDGVWRMNDEIIRSSMAASFGDSYKTSYVTPVEDVLATMAPEIEIEPHPEFINFTNGMLEWRTGELHDHEPSFKSTVQLPHRWNSDAECPTFDSWLSDRLPVDGVKLAWELIAVTLYNGNPIQRAGLLYGVGKSGKSTLLEVIQGLVGTQNTCSLSPQGMSKTVFATHMLLGKQSNIVTDIDPTKVSETAIFKQVVASEAIPAQQKNKPEFIFRPFCNHLFSANQIPRSSDRTSAWTRRFAILRFEHTLGETVKQIIDDYAKVLLQEAEGIIAKAVSVLPELLLRGDYSVVQADQEEFESATDFTRDFWDDVVEVTGNRSDFESKAYLARSFDLWCVENGYKMPPPFDDVVLRLRDNPLVETGRRRVESGRNNNPQRGFIGVKIRPEYRTAAAVTVLGASNQEDSGTSSDGFFSQ